MKKIMHFLSICMLLMFPVIFIVLDQATALAAMRLQQKNGPFIVVIDPGHGGENDGTTENGFLEKEMNLTTAIALYDELTKFDNIEVYLTRWDDRDLTLKQRAEFAAEKKADFLISIHYNAAESHALFGSEVWISLFPDAHNYGYQLGTEVLKEFSEMGLHLRGIKTKPHSKGLDYYGIIREAIKLNTPAMIIEHCHVDHAADNGFCDSKEELKAFGVADAHAIAKYFGLKSEAAGLDYTDDQDQLAEVTKGSTVARAMYDDTAPEECRIEVKDALYEADKVILTLHAKDEQSNIIDYNYSLDGGKTYSGRLPLPDGDILSGIFPESFEIEIDIPDGSKPEISLQVFNPYDQFTESNHLTFSDVFQKPIESIAQEDVVQFEDATDSLLPSQSQAVEKETESLSAALEILKILIPVVLTLFILLLFGYLIVHHKKANKND